MQADAGPNLLQTWITRAALRGPDRPWVISADDGRTVSYGQLREIAGRFAGFLRAHGIGANDRVALLAGNSIEQLLCYLGVMAAGATICTIHVEMNRNQLDNIFGRLKPRLILYQEDLGLDDLLATTTVPRMPIGRYDAAAPDRLFAEIAQHAPAETATASRLEDDAVILFTSGTSAKPKGVVLNFREYLLNIEPAAAAFAITENDRLYDFRPFSWASAQLLSALIPVNRGAALVLAERFSARRFFQHIRQHGVTVAAGNPTIINILLNGEAPQDGIRSLRFITSSSAPLMLEDWKRFEQKFAVAVAQCYGSSETSWIAAVAGEQRRMGTVGRPLAYHDLAIVDAEGRALPAGEIGHVELGGFPDHPFRYLAEDGAIEIHSRGRIRTGDLGFLDAEGFLTLTGREKELIIRGGAKISPVEIDSYLMRHAGVIEAATVGVPDPIYGEEVVSYVVARPGTDVDADELLRFCSDVLPAFKAPKRIIMTASLPKNARGKLDRRALAELG